MEKINNKGYRKFLIITYLASLIGFGGLMVSNNTYNEIWNNPLMIALFLLGILSPTIASLILVGDKFREKIELKKISIVFVLLMIHLALYFLFKRAIFTPREGNFLIINMIILAYSLSEFGWISLVYEYFKDKKDRVRSIFANGLFKTLYFLPLVLMPGFIVRPDFYAYLSGVLIGISAFSILIYEYTKDLYLSSIFTAIAISIMYHFELNVGGILIILGFIEVLIAYLIMKYLKV